MTKKADKKILENPLVSSMVVPVAIVLVGALIIFGVTKILSTERSYKDLVREMHSKTFGNRWVAAYELSKLISSSQIPKEDVPWLLQNLNEIYSKANDPRTRQFCVVAMGAMRTERAVPYLLTGVKDTDNKVRFHSVVALGNIPTSSVMKNLDWSSSLSLLSDDDPGIVQASILSLATHRVAVAEERILSLIDSPNMKISYSAALSLINFKNSKSLDKLKEILFLKNDPSWDANQILAFKLNILDALEKNKWNVLSSALNKISEDKTQLRLAAKAREVIASFKK